MLCFFLIDVMQSDDSFPVWMEDVIDVFVTCIDVHALIQRVKW